MAKFYFLIALIVLCFEGNSQIIVIPDANFKAKLLEADVTNNIASSTFSYVTPMKIDVNNNGEIEQSEAILVKRLDVSNSNISSIFGLELFSNLKRLDCSNNQLTLIDLNSLSILKYLDCSHNSINSLQIQNIDNSIDYLDCSYNNLTSIVFPNFYEFLDMGEQDIVAICSHNQLSSVVFSSVNPYEQLSGLDLSFNNLTSITFPQMEILGGLSLSNNPLTTVDFSNLYIGSQNPDFSYGNLFLDNTNLTSVTIPSIVDIAVGSSISNNPYLVHLNIKNGQNNLSCFYEIDTYGEETGNMICNGVTINNNPQLSLICCDENEINYYSGIVEPNVQISSYCNFTPGGDYKMITGNIKLDLNNNGCDENDNSIINLSVNNTLSSGYIISSIVTNSNGNFTFYIPSSQSYGNRIIKPQFENPYFSVSPSNYDYNYTTANNTETVNFCISPNGVHPDLEASIFPTTPARPGFDASYKLIIKNKGTETQSGTIGLNFDDTVLDFVSAFPATSSQVTNLLTWSFSDLAPFQSTEFLLTLNVNSPMETPAVNLGDILHYSATINTTTTDETPLDNQKELNQTVVGSFDPNDKTVVEGSQISISKIDDYLHYIIRFQNTGTYATENIVVKDIFTDKLDWSTLQMISSSHPFRSSLNGNILEVFYESINLPPSSVDEVGSHGYISFKIKPKQTVLVDDVIDNTAGIYFDYNFPIVTNTVSTVFTSLGVSDIGKNKFTIYPNPAKSIINIASPNNEIINSISIYNVVGQKLITSINQNSIDVSSLSKGSYFITIETDKGKGILKFLKE